MLVLVICFTMFLDVLTVFIMRCVLICLHKTVQSIITLLLINFAGVVCTWLVESHHKSGQLKYQIMPGAGSEGK